jgi:hypothetical protein
VLSDLAMWRGLGFGVVEDAVFGVGVGFAATTGSGVLDDRCAVRRGVDDGATTMAAGVGVAFRCEPNNHSKKERWCGFGAGVGTSAAGAVAGSPAFDADFDLSVDFSVGFSLLDVDEEFWSPVSLVEVEAAASLPWAGEASWAKTSAALAVRATIAVRTERNFGMMRKMESR